MSLSGVRHFYTGTDELYFAGNIGGNRSRSRQRPVAQEPNGYYKDVDVSRTTTRTTAVGQPAYVVRTPTESRLAQSLTTLFSLADEVAMETSSLNQNYHRKKGRKYV